jgi:ribonuclease HI
MASRLIIHTDGGARGNPGPAAIGVVIRDESGTLINQIAKKIGKSTNNHAEYQAVIEALQWLVEQKQGAASLQFILDSTLVVNQLSGQFKVKDANLKNQLRQVRQLEGVLKMPVTYLAVPREQNVAADRLVNEALDVIS